MTRGQTIAAARLVLAAGLIGLILVLPGTPADLRPADLLRLPLELPVLLLGLAILPAEGRKTQAVRGAIVLWLLMVCLQKTGDFGMYSAFNRPFNAILDLPLLVSAWDLAVGSVGIVLASLVLVLMLALFGVLGAALWWATGQWTAVELSRGKHRLATATTILAAGVMIADIGYALRASYAPGDPPGVARSARLLPERISLLRRTIADLRQFQEQNRRDRYVGAEHLLDRLAGRDVLFVFVESYGRTSLEAPLYAPTHQQTLRRAERALADAGLAVRSAWLTSPIVGGQSWLAHGTVASGLMIDNQTRYGAMLSSKRRTLWQIAAASGFRTAAVVPAITLAWPEGRVLGFQQILAAADLGYRGAPFNWITMPDQFTLTALDRLLRAGTDPRPLFAQVVLISSHAPWVPIPDLVAWDKVGDGTIFNQWATAGDPPEVVWRDPDRVRDQYRKSIDYTLRTVMDYAARQGQDPPLMIVLGDHQPAPFVAQMESREVPVHVIGPPDLVAHVASWGWTDGLIPDGRAPVWPMEAFRDRFLDAFTSDPPAASPP